LDVAHDLGDAMLFFQNVGGELGGRQDGPQYAGEEVTGPWRVCSLVAPRHPAFCPKTGALRILKQVPSQKTASRAIEREIFLWFMNNRG
jgi:hypothetical protein